jgi:hypothetical protein
MNKIFPKLILASTVALLSSCTTRLIDFTLISTKNVDLSRAGSFKRTGVRAKGEDKKHIIIIIPAGIPSAKEAVDRAIESVSGGVALVDGVLYQKMFYVPYIYGQNSYVVEGSVLVDPALSKLSAKNVEADGNVLVTCDASGAVATKRNLSNEDYIKIRRELGLAQSKS